MPRPFRARLVRDLAAVLACALLSSCAGGKVKLHPVRGKVFFQGAAAEGAVVVFQPTGAGADSALKPSGTVGADGSFTLQTHPHGDGAPAGEYVVLVTWYPANARELDNPPNKLPPRYANPSAALLKATVKEGPNELDPFRLTP